jgi:dihydrolipoamide dehydrogenase
MFDLTVIGGGPGGYTAAFKASRLGMKVALVEAFKIGGVCLQAGCIPYKALLESARVSGLVRNAGEFGVDASMNGIDFSRMMSRKNKVVERLEKGLAFLVENNKVAYFDGLASLAGLGKVRVKNLKNREEQTIETKDIIIATGSKPKFIQAFAADGKKILYSDHIVALAEAPASIAILGGGPIGVETATLMRALGSSVVILEAAPRIMINEDEEISFELKKQLEKKGITIEVEAKVAEADKKDTGVTVDYTDSGGDRRSVDADCLLVAIGREGLTNGLGLETAGVGTEHGYIKVNVSMRTTASDIYAIGDVAGPPLLAHKASAEAIVAVETIAGRDTAPVDMLKIPHCTYCEPQVASIGLTEAQAAGEQRKIKTGRFSFKINGKALCESDEIGFIKIIADKDTDEILGVHMIGGEVTELIQECAEAMYAESTLEELKMAVHAHPTRSEALKEAALDADGESVMK